MYQDMTRLDGQLNDMERRINDINLNMIKFEDDLQKKIIEIQMTK
jgi:hypothetical protein